jgi:hypothetical protein
LFSHLKNFLDLQLALEIAVAAQPLLNIVTVTLEPVDLGADGVQALLNGTVEAL